MKVTKINYNKKKDVFEVIFDNDEELILNYSIFEKYKISLDVEFSDNEIVEMKYFSDFERAKMKAIKYISGRLKTKKEVSLKLREEFSLDIIDEILFFLEKNGYLDDKMYARLFIEDKKKLNGYGQNKIKYLLNQKGISNDIFYEIIAEFDDEYENALNLGIKKLDLLKNEEDKFKKKQKIITYLSYRGFSFDIINRVLEEIL